MSQGLRISALVQPCCTSQLLWRCGRVSDFHSGDPGSIPGWVRSEDIFASPVTIGQFSLAFTNPYIGIG